MEELYIISFAAILLFILYLFLIFPALRRHPDRENLNNSYIAHRGFHNATEGIPENSISSFIEAIVNGYTIEIDIHLTKDGKVVVFHDNTLSRMCGVDRMIEDCTFEELSKLTLIDSNEKIPTLEQCLQTVDGRVPLLIEFKVNSLANSKALCFAANEILKYYKGKYYIQSFYPFVLSWYKKHRKDICRGQLSSVFKGRPLRERLLGLLVFNFISRPDFVSYDYNFCRNFSNSIAILLGAFPVCWTFRSQKALDKHKKDCKAYIFENFIPEK